ncbi:ribosomal RNA processing protein 1 homolog A isoform X2 [Antennarius striatus]|uniref:ribosomal RNA processing protein 1 homolog A isoform X2 n=1 Tax=Antennarius striatus TaxID=241820 RepID=UPI0035B2F045
MAAVQEPEVQFAQRLASNERPVRTKALRKLRKYINVRSQKAGGGFTGDELLKLWKGLFYCVWMQDKPQLQEELSNKISSLLHSFQDVDGQILYLESFMQTFKREWTGIDRLRMDKFYQLVRFMFRQAFEMLKRKNWDSSAVSRFLELLTAQLLETSGEVPIGLQFHALDVYMSELAAVGSAELTADQNLTFIEPFCITAAKTKDQALFDTICNSIFSTIMDQAPLAIVDLMKELKAADVSGSDSGQASAEEEEDLGGRSKKPVGKINGNKSKEEEEEDELLHLEESDMEAPYDDDTEPVLQFDYGALANKLFDLSKRSNTPSKSRQRLYKIIRGLRNLSKGIFPSDNFPEEVSTDEDDDMFCSRKRMKRKSHLEEDEGRPSFKKKKGDTKKASAPKKLKNDSAKDNSEPAELCENKEKKKRKKKKKKKKAVVAKGSESTTKATGDPMQSAVSATEAATSETVKERPSATGGTGDPAPGEEEETSATEPETPADAAASGKKKKRRRRKRKSQTEGIEAESQVNAGEENTPLESDATVSGEKTKSPEEVNGVGGEDTSAAGVQADSVTPRKKRKRNKNLKADEGAKIEAVSEITSVSREPSEDTTAPLPEKKKGKQEVAAEASPAADEHSRTPRKNRRKSHEEDQTGAEEEPAQDAEKPLVVMATPAKKKKKRPSFKEDEDGGQTELQVVRDKDAEPPMGSAEKPAKKKRKTPVTFEYEADELEAAAVNGNTGGDAADAGETSTPLSTGKKKTKATTPESDFITFQNDAAIPMPLFCKTKMSPGSKRRTPKSDSKKVTFGLTNNKTAEFKKTDRSLLLSPDGSSRVPFDPRQKPKFGVLKSPATPASKKIKKTPKKATFATPTTTPKRRPSAADFF